MLNSAKVQLNGVAGSSEVSVMVKPLDEQLRTAVHTVLAQPAAEKQPVAAVQELIDQKAAQLRAPIEAKIQRIRAG
jgi:hypothetical protein